MESFEIKCDRPDPCGGVFIGIDPGLKGAYAAIDGCSKIISYTKTPLLKGGGVDWSSIFFWYAGLSLISHPRNPAMPGDGAVHTVIALEDVHPLPGVSAKSSWTFSENKGENKMLMFFYKELGHGSVETLLIAPKSWQKLVWDLSDRVEKAGRCDTKATSLNCAQRLWPGEPFRATERSKTPDDGIVDALLIAEAARRKILNPR